MKAHGLPALAVLLAFLLVAPAYAQAQAPTLILYQTGAQLPFLPEDITAITYEDQRQEGRGFLVLTLTPSMSDRLQAFTQALVGGTMMTVAQGRVLTAGTQVRSAIAGPVVHLSGSRGTLRPLAERLDAQRQSAADPTDPLLLAYEQGETLAFDASQIEAFTLAEQGDRLVLRLPADQTEIAGEPGTWLVALGGEVVEAQVTLMPDADGDGTLALTLHGLNAAQRDGLRQAAQDAVR